MIRHIFKKDARLLWWLATAVAFLRFAEVALAQGAGLFPPARVRNMMMLLGIGGILATGFAICAVVHQDSIPGLRQDWLVRPIRRRDLLWAKVLFIALPIQVPIFVADVAQGLLTGASVAASLGAAFSRSVYLLLTVGIPFLAFASVTKNLLEAITGGVAVSLTFATFAMLFLGDPGRRFQPTFGTGLEWITVSSLALFMLMGCASILGLQYLRRRTFLARCLTGAFTMLSIFATFVPWKPAFAIQRALSAESNSSAAVAISFDPALKVPAGHTFAGTDALAAVFVPFRISGLPVDSALGSDRTEVRLTEPNGRMHTLSFSSRAGARHTPGNNPDQTIYQTFGVASDLYRSIAHKPVRLDIEFSLTMFKLTGSYWLPALNANSHLAELGWCATRINAANTGVQLSCAAATQAPGCTAVHLENPTTGLQNPENFSCERSDYGPYPNWQLLPDALTRFGLMLPFRDANGLAKYPVDASQLAESHIAMRIYQPVDHFTRKLVIPEIRLSDWDQAP
ncbi:MAG: hypothetical protein JO307_22385 [Bryobacterales bacterium]|nr:hypothetical protein [Bryobacterales bacterium]MBV9401508.1 hypothetical protein [Bryobacterales bacterium]